MRGMSLAVLMCKSEKPDGDVFAETRLKVVTGKNSVARSLDAFQFVANTNVVFIVYQEETGTSAFVNLVVTPQTIH